MPQNKIKISNIRNNFIALLAFVMPLNKSLVPIIIVINLILWFAESHWQQKLQAVKDKRFLLAISLYLWHLLGILYTDNLKAGGFDLEQKLSLLLFPLMFLTYLNINSEDFNNINKQFTLGCLLAGIICFANAFYKYYLFSDTDVFYYGQFSAIMHTSYFSMYLCLAVIMLLYNDGILKQTYARFALIIFFIMCIIFVSSKSGIIALILIGISKIFYEFSINRSIKQIVWIVGLMLVVLFGFAILFPKSVSRLESMKRDLYETKEELNTTSSRVAIWKHAFEIIKQHLVFGVGTGDVKDALKEAYIKKGEQKLAEKQLNAHNQYLQTFIALGLVGFALLMMILFTVLIQSIKNRNTEGILLTLLIAFNLLFESMLETQAGVVFIAFFLTFYFKIATDADSIKNSNIAT